MLVASPHPVHCLSPRHYFYTRNAESRHYSPKCRFANGSHIELPCNEVSEPEASEIAAKLSSAAYEWWQSVIQEPNSFVKTTAYLGVAGQLVTNMLTTGAKERTAGNTVVVQNGVTGFSSAGDRICMNVKVRVMIDAILIVVDIHHFIASSSKVLYFEA